MTEPGVDDQSAATASSDTPSGPKLIAFDVESVVTVGVVALLALALLAVFDQAAAMLTRIFVGIVLALALDPVVGRIRDRTGWPRGVAVAILGAVLGAGAAGLLLVVGPAAIEQASSLRDDLPRVVEDAYGWPVLGDRLEARDAAVQVSEWIDDLPSALDDDQITRFAEDLLGGLLTTIIVVVTAVAVMLDGERLVELVRRIVLPSARPRVDAVGRVIYRTFGNYFAGSLFVALLNGLVILTVALALGVPLAPLAGLWAALTNLVPQIGGFLGGGFLVLLALTEGPLTAAIALVVFLVYQNIENNVIQPAVVGRAVDLSPPTTMLAALVGGAVAGVPGALVATPLLGAAKVLYLRDTADGELDGEGLDDPVSG